MARAGIDALEGFAAELGLPGTLKALGVTDKDGLKQIAASCHYSPGGYRKLGSDEMLEIFQECFD